MKKTLYHITKDQGLISWSGKNKGDDSSTTQGASQISDDSLYYWGEKAMKTFRDLLLVLVVTASLMMCQSPSDTYYDLRYRQRADSILVLMTLEEKIGQLNLPAAGDITTGQASSSDIAEKIKAGQIGGLFNIKTVEKISDC
jgi:hypothetical protein